MRGTIRDKQHHQVVGDEEVLRGVVYMKCK